VRADGSGVDPDQEAAELAKNALEHQALVSVAGTRTGILQIAMGVR
jgi:flagellar basal body rod protein FlgB